MDTPLSAIPVTYLSRILAVLMAIILVAPGSYAQGVPSATPISESPSELSGSISLVGWDGVTKLPFEVIDVNGVLLESGTLSTDHYVSELLVAAPGSTATLSIPPNSAFTENSATSVADENGELHFEVVLDPLIDVGGSIQSRSSNSESDQIESEILYTISLSSSAGQPLAGHLVTVVDASGIEVSARSDISGNAVFSLLSGTYDVRVDPYGAQAGLDLSIVVTAEANSTLVTLAWLQASGSLRVRAKPILDGQPLVRVFNGAGLMIGEAPLADPAGVLFSSLAFGANYVVQIDGNETYRRTTLEPFDFRSGQVVEVPMVKRPWGKAIFILSTSDGSALPDAVEITAINDDWSGAGIAVDNGEGKWVLILDVMRGDVHYEIHAEGYQTYSGSKTISSNTQISLVLLPSIEQPTPEPTAVPSPTPEPTAVPSPTPEPTAIPSPTPEPTAVPSPTPEPTAVPSPTPEPTAVPSPTPMPTAVPSPTPQPSAVPSPTPEPTAVPSPTPEPTSVPSPTPMPTAVPSPTPAPTAVPSPTPEPTAVPSPTPLPTAIPSPTPMPTAVPSPTPAPTAVPSPTPEPTAVPRPTPAPTAVPSPTPEPTVVPNPTPEPTAVPSPTPEPTAVPSPTPEPTAVPSPTPEPTAVPSPTPEPTAVPSPTPEPTAVPSPTPEPTAVPSPTPEPTAVPSPTPEPTAVPSPTPQPTAVPSPTPEPTAIPSPTPEPTAVPSPTPEPTAVPSPTPQPTAVPSPTPQPTVIPSPTPEPTAMPSPTLQPTAVPSPAPTAVPSPTPQPTAVPSPTPLPTAVQSPTAVVENNGHIVTGITFQTSGSLRLEGAPYDLYAPVASQSAVQPYHSGVVGAGNRIELVDMPAGQYRLVVRPSGLLPIELLILVGLSNTELILPVEPTLSESVSVPMVPVKVEYPAGNGVADTETTASIDSDLVLVTGLPSTGSTMPVVPGPWGVSMKAVLFLAVLSAGLAWKRTSEQ